MDSKPKIIVIVGPTASGKSDLAVLLAKKFDGEIISADSRQVYEGLDIGTGKITKKEMWGVPHHLLDVANPKKIFSVSDYKKLGEKALEEILRRKKVPVIVGGTGFYIQALVDGVVLPEVPPNPDLRKKLQKLPVSELFEKLKKLDSERAKTVDAKNSVRLIRAIEIATALGKVPQVETEQKYDPLFIGVRTDEVDLKKRIHDRLLKRLKQGMIVEIRNLYKNGLTWKRMEQLGLEYRYVAQFLQKRISKTEMISTLEKEIWHYAKRQITWFKRDKRINWYSINEMNKILTKVKIFLK